MKVHVGDQFAVLREMPFQDLGQQSSLTYTSCKNVVPTIDLTRQISAGFEDNIFKFKEREKKVLEKKMSMKVKFGKRVTSSFYYSNLFVLYFFREGVTVHDLRENRIYDIDFSFPSVIRCALVRNDMFLMLTEAASASVQSDPPRNPFHRSISTFDLKKEKFHQSPEFARLNIVDFAMVGNFLVVLTRESSPNLIPVEKACLRLRGYRVQVNQLHSKILTHHVLYLDFNNDWASLDIPHKSGLLFLNGFSFSRQEPRVGTFPSQVFNFTKSEKIPKEVKANKKTLEFLDLAGNMQHNLRELSFKSRNLFSVRKLKHSKKYVQELEKFDFRLIQNYQQAVEVVVFRPLACRGKSSAAKSMLELLTIDFTDHSSFSGKSAANSRIPHQVHRHCFSDSVGSFLYQVFPSCSNH